MKAKFLVVLVVLSFWSNYFLNARRRVTPIKRIPADTLRFIQSSLTDTDRKNYLLTATIGNLTESTCPDSDTFYPVTVTLTNKSMKTLEYFDWSCGHDIWLTNSRGLYVQEGIYCEVNCERNIVTTFKIPPQESRTFRLSTGFPKRVIPESVKFKVGMVLLQSNKNNHFLNNVMGGIESNNYHLHDQTQAAVWSNQLVIKFNH